MSYRQNSRHFGGRNSRASFGRNKKINTSKSSRGKESIHFTKFIKPAVVQSATAVYSPTNSFDDFCVHELVKSNISQKGITTPSPIQDQSIPHSLEGRDIIGIANTGTGKTLAFAVPVINKILNNKKSAAIILAPTRELAQQIEAEFAQIAKKSGILGATIIGGSPMGPQLSALRSNPEVVIGTPGRIKDHINQRSLDLSRFDTIVLDEFDRMLDMGFIGDIRTIIGKLPVSRQSLFFSATLDNKIKELSDEFLSNPVTIRVSNGDTTDNVSQDVVRYREKDDKLKKLCNLLQEDKVSKVLIFDETKHGADRLGKKLADNGFSAGSIHGGKTQGSRQRTLQEFKSNKITILVATDVAARGIDVADITHVINYATPRTYTDYIHRIGRAGRAGRAGYAFTFVESRDF
jgi:Superfamily II DNA and RNA helicases